MKRCDLPSQKRYRERNPSISFRLKRQDKEKLDAIIERSCKPLSSWMTDFLHDKLIPYEISDEERESIAAYYDDLCDDLKNEERFTVPCSVCGKPMNFSSKDSNWTSKEYPVLKKAFSTWHHGKCKSK